MATKKRQQKLPEEKQIGRKKQRSLEKENVETKIDDDETLLKRLDNVFMVKHPPELLNFWRHAVKLKPKKPLDAFSELDSLELVGPFLLLAAAHSERHAKNTKNGATATADEDAQQQNHLLLGSRFATDLPEMETLLVHRGGRFCYWRDVPEEMPNILVHVAGGGEGHVPAMTICGERDLFAALQFVLNNLVDTGTTTTAKAKRQQSNNTGTTTTSNTGVKPDQKLALFPDNFGMSNNGADYLKMLKKRRAKESLGMPFHGIGIKVPVNNKGIGYRPLSDDAKENAQLKRNTETMGTTDNEENKTEPRKKFYQMSPWVQLSFCLVFLLLSFLVLCCCASNQTQTSTTTDTISSNNSFAVTKPPFFLPTDPFWRPVFDAMIYAAIAISAITVIFGVPFMIFIACVACRSSRNSRRLVESLEQRAQQRREAARIDGTAALRNVLEMRAYSRKY